MCTRDAGRGIRQAADAADAAVLKTGDRMPVLSRERDEHAFSRPEITCPVFGICADLGLRNRLNPYFLSVTSGPGPSQARNLVSVTLLSPLG